MVARCTLALFLVQEKINQSRSIQSHTDTYVLLEQWEIKQQRNQENSKENVHLNGYQFLIFDQDNIFCYKIVPKLKKKK